jgi:hypothetical protein
MNLREQIAETASKLRRLRKRARAENRQQQGLGPKRKGKGLRVSDRDEAEKVRRGYTNPGSYVRRDGSEVLKGNDWKQRVWQLKTRSGGNCERFSILGKGHVSECSMTGIHPHHIIKRSTRRDDRLSNLAWLSGVCHAAEDPRQPQWSKP